MQKVIVNPKLFQPADLKLNNLETSNRGIVSIKNSAVTINKSTMRLLPKKPNMYLF